MCNDFHCCVRRYKGEEDVEKIEGNGLRYRKLRKLWEVRYTVVPVVIGAIGTR